MPHCRHFPACGGCQTLDRDYATQLADKHAELRRLFAEWPDLAIDPVLPSPRTEGYRHKVQLPFGFAPGAHGHPILGCYAAGSHAVIDQHECLVQEPSLSRAAWAVRAWAAAHRLPIYREATGTGWLRHILLRRGAGSGEILLGLISNGAGIKSFDPRGLLPDLLTRVREAIGAGPEGGELIGIVQSVNARNTNVVLGEDEILWWGRSALREELGPFVFRAGLSSFLQVNPFQAPRLYDLAVAALPDGARVLDLYCGVGTLSLWAARKAVSVIGVEENPAAVADARKAAAENGIRNARFLAADVGEALSGTAGPGHGGGIDPAEFGEAEAILADPPRKGLEEKVRKALLRSSASRLVYVSCHPASLARDARALAGAWRLEALRPVDLFPHTRHVECVAVFGKA
ncbi:MAG: 23S rRNA (uracil(1939)-C(5))-methyltransferase RlmD [Fibrobacteres bacterium]|nr:23S rRNA (uracil(1939)-C(5))-methyltransferase RlmD [Fibrobacterota bacterium]